ncbi:hypothetical protein TRFO_17590 [Tritrichomonas foetus]|uniref:Uncharacterized protein n=1 Tax=Tritrichomonas foetus TaxID=1144522 RepID=A0A1J4KRU3_9EUKA|nr:hypothetical protein TRFO_17590 [Tritrichomonas foetus]|eukprot:OHT12540.1 hypothetical protein TRFO_17590 [Tritrichomonas foetus]
MLEDYEKEDLHDEQQKNTIRDLISTQDEFVRNDLRVLTVNHLKNFQKKLSCSSHEQMEVISNLRVFVLKSEVKPSILPENFIFDFVNVFSSSSTTTYVKTALLSLSDDMMKYDINFVKEFEKYKYYMHILNEMINQTCCRIEYCLPVLNHFLRHSKIATSYLFGRNLPGFILDQITTEKNSLRTSITLYNSLQAISTFTYQTLNPESMARIVDICLDKIIPNKNKKSFIDLETSIIVPIVKTLANMMKFIPDGEYLDKIVNSGVSSFILTIVTNENFELSVAALNLLCDATFRSNVICAQLKNVGAVQELSRLLLFPEFFKVCSKQCLRTIYNILVAFHGNNVAVSYSFECMKDENFKKVIKYVLAEGKSFEKDTIYIILGIIIYFSEPENVLKYIQEFDILDNLQSMIDTGNNEGAHGALAIAYRLADLAFSSIYNSQILNDFSEIMHSDEMIDSLNNFMSCSSDEDVCNYARYLLSWIYKDKKPNSV